MDCLKESKFINDGDFSAVHCTFIVVDSYLTFIKKQVLGWNQPRNLWKCYTWEPKTDHSWIEYSLSVEWIINSWLTVISQSFTTHNYPAREVVMSSVYDVLVYILHIYTVTYIYSYICYIYTRIYIMTSFIVKLKLIIHY